MLVIVALILCCCFRCCLGVFCLLGCLLLCWASGRQEDYQKRQGQKVEQLPGKIKEGSSVSNCENYGVYLFLFLRLMCMNLQQHHANRGFSQLRALFFGGVVSGAKSWVNKWPTQRVNKWSTFWLNSWRHMWTTYWPELLFQEGLFEPWSGEKNPVFGDLLVVLLFSFFWGGGGVIVDHLLGKMWTTYYWPCSISMHIYIYMWVCVCACPESQRVNTVMRQTP